MAYSRAYVRSFARDASLTIDYEMYTKILLADLPVFSIPELPALDLASINERMVHEKFKIHQATAPYLQSICYSPTQLGACYKEFESQRLTKLELPLLKTDPENDIYDHEDRVKCQQTQHFEALKTVDISSADQSLLDARTATILDPHDGRRIEQFSCIVPRAAGDLLKRIVSAEKLSCAAWQRGSATKAKDPFNFECPMTPFQEPKQPSTDDFSGLQLTSSPTMDHKTEDFENMDQPGDAMDNPYVIDSLEDEFARFSVTPEAEMHAIMLKQSRKLGSPLTPPNSVRSHRKIHERDPKKIMQSSSIITAQSASSCPSNYGSAVNTPVLQEARHPAQDQILSRNFHTRDTLRKVELNNLNHAPVPSPKASTLDFKAQTSFKQEVWKTLHDLKLPNIDTQDWAWAPWAPFQFDEDTFPNRFDISPDGKTVQSFKIPEPIDPRTLLNFVSVDEYNSDDREPLKLARPWDFFSLSRKRKSDSVYDVKDHKDFLPRNLEKAQGFDAFENSFPGMAFGLFANSFTRLKRFKVTASTRPVSENEQPPNEGYDISQTLISPIELSPQPDLSHIQLIVTSCGVMPRRAIGHSLPGVKVVERDFTDSWISKDGIPIDGDIILSPQTCILLVTIEEIQQQPLPGTLSVSKFRRKIAILTHKFETIYIFVKTKNASDRNVLLQCRASMEQEGRMTDTVIHMEDFEENQEKVALYPRIANLVKQEHIQTLNLALCDEETDWEKYLRKKMGVNAYAAQAIMQKSPAGTINGWGEPLSTLRYLYKHIRLQDLNDILGEKSSKLLSKELSRFEEARIDVLLNNENMYS